MSYFYPAFNECLAAALHQLELSESYIILLFELLVLKK
jgi:hypothetical protein